MAVTIPVGEHLYEVSVKFTRVSEFGVSMEALSSGKVPPPHEGARFDVAFEGNSSSPKLKGTVTGVDYLHVRADGRFQLHIHAEVTTEDGATICALRRWRCDPPGGKQYRGPQGERNPHDICQRLFLGEPAADMGDRHGRPSAVIAKLLVRRRTVWYLAAHESSCRIAADRRAACHIGALGARAGTTPQRLVFRSRIVLLAARGMPSTHVARQLDTSQDTVRLWRRRCAAGGPDACGGAMRRDEVGNGRLPPLANNRSSRHRCTGRRHARRSGVCGRWPPPRACVPRRSIGSGSRMACSRIVSAPSRCRPIPRSSSS